MHTLNTPNDQHTRNGFTLVELAIVLLIVTVLIGSAITAFRVQITYTKTSQAREQIREAREAVINFAIAKGRLPCPSPYPDLAPPSDGMEGNCHLPKGLLPWKDLGLPSKDPWGQTLRYGASYNLAQIGFGFDTPGSLQIYSGAANIDPKSAVAFSVWSTGEDAKSASDPISVAANAIVAEAPDSDDIVEWVSRYVLFGKMMAAAKTVPLNASSSSASASSTSSSSASSTTSSASSS